MQRDFETAMLSLQIVVIEVLEGLELREVRFGRAEKQGQEGAMTIACLDSVWPDRVCWRWL